MKKINIAMNGFGRIGRDFFRNAINNPLIEIIFLLVMKDRHKKRGFKVRI